MEKEKLSEEEASSYHANRKGVLQKWTQRGQGGEWKKRSVPLPEGTRLVFIPSEVMAEEHLHWLEEDRDGCWHIGPEDDICKAYGAIRTLCALTGASAYCYPEG
jgi:hypothetical protein